MNNYILLILLLFSFPLQSLQSGISLHLSLIARSNLPHELPLNYLLSGAFYPDSFYNCLGLSSIGEYDHWTPFLYELVKYYNQLPQPDLEFKLFIYGILNHQITDITWHSLNLHQGLLKFLNNVECGNDEDFTKCHTLIDAGGDFIILDRLLQNLSLEQRGKILEFFKTPWLTPTRHLINVYHQLGYKQINEGNLEYCMLRGYTALQLEISSMALETNPSNYYKEQSPLFVDMLETYHLGGLQEIINTLDTCLPNLGYWFNNIDKIKDSREICNTMAGSSISSSTISKLSLELQQDDIIFISPYIPKSYFGSSLAMGHFLGDDRDCVAISSPFENGEGSIYIIPLDEFALKSTTTTTNTLIKLTSANEKKTMTYPTRFGFKMLTFMDQFLLVSSPGSSILKFFYKERELLQLQTPQSDNIIGETGLKQLGILLENDDDTNDIIIGTKYADFHSYEEQKGQFMVLNGDLILMNLLQTLQSSSDSKVMNINLFVKEIFQLPLLLNQVSNYENFASQFSSLHNFKAISVENLGIVVIYENSTPIFIINHDLKIYNYKENHLTDKIKKTSSLQNSQFGANFVKLIEINDNVYLIVSAKSYSDSNFIQSGAGFIFAVKRNEIKLIAKISLSDKKNLDQFFHMLIIMKSASSSSQTQTTKILITSSNYNLNQGSIWECDLSNIINQYNGEIIDYNLNVNDHLIQLGPKNVGFTDFGQSLAYSNGKLIVGMPFFGYSELFNIDLQLIGKVGIYNYI